MSEKVKVQTIIDYASSFFASFDEVPFNELDASIFAKLSYFNYSQEIPNFNKDKIKLKDLYDLSRLDRILKRPAYKDIDKVLFTYICGNPRYMNTSVSFYKEITSLERNEQFAAVCFEISKQLIIVSFRGTDSSLNGWKEDFNMAYAKSVPSQLSSFSYIREISKKRKRAKLILVGHSKGGNLASYALLTAKPALKNKILCSYSFDGPNVSTDLMSKYHFDEYKNKFIKIRPEETIIGLIYDDGKSGYYVKSEEKLIYQHSMYNWHVDLEKNSFVKVDKPSPNVYKLSISINQWVEECSDEQKELLIDTLYDLVVKTGYSSLTEIMHNKKECILLIRKKYKEIDEKTRKELSGTLKKFFILILNMFISKKSTVNEDDDLIDFTTKNSD